MKIKIWEDLGADVLRIAFLADNEDSRIVYHPTMNEMKELSLGATIPDEYVIKLPLYPTNGAQELMDALTRLRVRPSDEMRVQGELVATKKHLEDMRTLVFKEKGGGQA